MITPWTQTVKTNKNTFLTFTFELKFKVILKVIFQSKNVSKVKNIEIKNQSQMSI